MKSLRTCVSILLLLAFPPAWAKDFTLADLQQMVTELDRVIPENPKYLYPVKCSIEKNDDVNAYATLTKEGSDLRATMVVDTGIIEATNGDARLIRAVVAHELSHLSRGHLTDIDPDARDLRNLWTRQQEFEADKYGAIALVKAGYSKKDMVDMLLFLDSLHDRSQGGWLDNLTADHADAKARAAEISDNPAALKVLVTFDTALAYEDARSHLYAQRLFDYSVDQWPDLKEAYINAGKCSLLFYYDNLPEAVRAKWWTPDFGPLITTPHAPAPQATEITDTDRQAYQDAMQAISKAVDENPGNQDALELLALAAVLEPDAKKDVVQTGIDWFVSQSASTKDDVLRLRYANNAGVGYHQLSDVQSAYNTIFAAQKTTDVFNAALGENLGLVRVDGTTPDEDQLTANVLFTWLSDTPEASSPRWDTVKTTFDEVCKRAGIQPKEIKPKAAYLCQVVTLVTNNKEIGLLLPVDSLKRLLGDPQDTVVFADKWPDLTELRWDNGNVSVLTERGNAMRLTSYQDGAYLELKPHDATSQVVLQVKVGMSKDDLFNILDPKASVEKDMARGDDVEQWTYFPDLDVGVLIQNDVIKGITVSPVQYEESSGS